MKSFEDKVWSEGSLENILNLTEIMREELPHSTFPMVEGEPGTKKLLIAKLNKSPDGTKEIAIKYPKEEGEQNRRINLPAGSEYVETTHQTVIKFAYKETNYEITLPKE